MEKSTQGKCIIISHTNAQTFKILYNEYYY